MYARQTGFTLAEVLIALALLGVVATFSLPKVLQTVNNQHYKSVVKEAVGALSTIVYDGHIRDGFQQPFGSLPNLAANNLYIKNRINYASVCDNPTICNLPAAFANAPTTFTQADPDQPNYSYILPNGTYLMNIGTYGSGEIILFVIDANGLAAPNICGQDQLWVEARLDTGAVVLPTVPGVDPEATPCYKQMMS